MLKDDGTNKFKADIIALIESRVKDQDEGEDEDEDENEDEDEDEGEDEDEDEDEDEGEDGKDSINLGDGTEGVA